MEVGIEELNIINWEGEDDLIKDGKERDRGF